MPKLWNQTIAAHRQDVRQAILATTAELAARHGLRAVTMAQIAEQAGIGRATLYKYFSGVDEILSAWHQHLIADHMSHLVELRDQVSGAGARLRAVLEAYAKMNRGAYSHHDSDLAALMHRDKKVKQAEHKLHSLLEELIRDAAGSGEVRKDLPPAELATYCLHALGAVGSQSSETASQRLISVILDGLKPPV